MANVEVRGSLKNLSASPDIAFQYQESGQPWGSVTAAHNGTPEEYRAPGKLRFVDAGDGRGPIEYWYKGGIALENLVQRYENLESAAAYVAELEGLKTETQTLKEQTEDIKQEVIDIAAGDPIYLGFWDASENIPALSTVVPASGVYYEVGKTGTQNITGVNVLYEEGRKIISNGTVWQISKGMIPGNKTVSVEKLVEWLQLLFQQLPDNSPYLEVKIDDLNRKLWSIRKSDGFIEGRFVIEAVSMMVNAVHTASIQPNAVNLSKLAENVKALIYQNFDNTSSPYWRLHTDSLNRILWAEKKDGSVFIPKPEFRNNSIIEAWLSEAVKSKLAAVGTVPNASVTASKLAPNAVDYTKLAEAVKYLMYQSFDNTSSPYWRLHTDSLNRIIWAEKKDGSFFVSKPEFPVNSIAESSLSQSVKDKLPTPSFLRLNSFNTNDVEVETDQMWRSQEIDIPVKTDNLAGAMFCQFVDAKTKVLKGLNITGTSLTFRKSNNVTIRGKRFRGTFNPNESGVIGTNYRGVYGNSANNTYPAFASGATGDCWVADCGYTTATKTANGLTFKNGDMIVKTASGYAVQPGPGDGLTNVLDFWNVSETGYFGGINYIAGTRIYVIGKQWAGGPQYIIYCASRASEFYYMGEVDPTTFTPASPFSGDCYNFSSAGTTQGITGAVGDSLVYEGGWGLVRGEAVIVPNGNTFYLPCSDNASEWAVRRTDKSSSVVTVNAKGAQARIVRKNGDSVLLISDSMFGVNGLGNKVLINVGRSGAVLSYGGSGSDGVVSMYKNSILKSDPYATHLIVFWHGQNNQDDIAAIKIAAYEMASIVGFKNKKIVFWSVLGQRTATFVGGRIVIDRQESAKAGTNNIAEIERFYEKTFPKQYFSPRKALLASAVGRTFPDPQFPGMTEEQVAATYGIVPFSYFFDYTGKPFTATNLVFLGYHSGAGLPAGGNDKEYYIRTGNGTAGQLIVNVASTWIEYSHDFTHLTEAGAIAVAGQFSTFFNTLNL